MQKLLTFQTFSSAKKEISQTKKSMGFRHVRIGNFQSCPKENILPLKTKRTGSFSLFEREEGLKQKRNKIPPVSSPRFERFFAKSFIHHAAYPRLRFSYSSTALHVWRPSTFSVLGLFKTSRRNGIPTCCQNEGRLISAYAFEK